MSMDIRPAARWGSVFRGFRGSRAFRPMTIAVFLAMTEVCGLSAANAETLHDAIHAAWALDPSSRSYAVDASAAQKNANALKSWFPGGPVVSGQYYDDHFIGSNQGYTSYMGSVSVPLWLPGQGTAQVRNALADEDVAKAHIRVERLLVAVRVLELASIATLFQKEIENLRHTSALLEHAVHASRQGLRAGEIASADFDAVVGESEDLHSRISESEQKLDGASAELNALTGSDDIPDIMTLDGRVLGAGRAVLDPERDPRVAMSDAVSRSARAGYEVARHSYMPNPTVGVMVMKQTQYQAPWNTQVGAQVSIPLPSEAQHVPMVMKEVRAMGAADRDAVLARRKVAVEYRQTRTKLASSIETLRHARATQDAWDQRAADLEQAWRAGEAPVVEYLRARRSALDARQRAAQADVVWHTSLVRMTLMAGNDP